MRTESGLLSPEPSEPGQLEGRRSWPVVLLVAIGLLVATLPWLPPVTRLDNWLADHMQMLQTRSVLRGPLTVVDWDPGAPLLPDVIDRLLEQGVVSVGVHMHPTMQKMIIPDPLPAHWLGRVFLPEQGGATGQGLRWVWPDGDGVARHLYLHQGPADDPHKYAHWLVTMLDRSGMVPAEVRRAGPNREAGSGWPRGWTLTMPIGIGMAGPPGHFKSVSARDVVEGRLPARSMEGRLVIVGMTGPASDQHATALGRWETRMSGVEWMAHAADALIRDRTWGEVSALSAWTLTVLLLLPVSLLSWRLSDMRLLYLSLGTALVAVIVSAVLFVHFQMWWGPTPTVVVAAGLVVALAAGRIGRAWYLMGTALQRALGDVSSRPPMPWQGRAFDVRLKDLLRRLSRQSELGRWCLEALLYWPDAALVCTTDGRVRYGNLSAARMLGIEATNKWQMLTLESVLEKILDGSPPAGLEVEHAPEPSKAAQICRAALASPPVHSAHECMDRDRKDWLIKVSPTYDRSGEHSGWVVSLIDISSFKAGQRQRDDELHFLGHDLRSPQSAALAVLDVVRQNPAGVDAVTLAERVERHLRRSLALSEAFIQLLRAQSGSLRRDTVNLGLLVADTVDAQWDRARVKGVDLKADVVDDAAECLGDHEMLGRALDNLVVNAIKFSPEGGTVRCWVERQAGYWAVVVADQGPGIDSEGMARLFKPFVRISGSRRVEGAGLGLPMVKAVVERHGGWLDVRSEPGRGSEFRMLLPAGSESADEHEEEAAA